jgi:sortase A
MTVQPLRSTRRRGRKASVVGIIGELLITAGVLVFLFLGWQLWLNDIIVGAVQDKVGIALGKTWGESASPTHEHAVKKDYGEPIIPAAQKNAAQFAVMYVPRFGTDYARSIAQGVGTGDVLDKGEIGHYPNTQMPGEIGNFALAGHRTTHGAPFNLIATLRVGDKIYIQTADGYYTYDFRGLEYVRPTGIAVIDSVPQSPGVTSVDRVLTMTSCNPKLSSAERIIAYAVFDSWQPKSAGPPAAIAASLSAKG